MWELQSEFREIEKLKNSSQIKKCILAIITYTIPLHDHVQNVGET